MHLGDTIKKLSPLICSVLMGVVTFCFPITITSFGWGSTGDVYWVDIAVIAVLWIFFPQSENWNPMGFGLEGYGFFFLNPVAIFNTAPFWILSILFAIQVVRYRLGKTDGKKTLLIGIASLIPPTLVGILGLVAVVQAGVVVYVGPIPFQFLLGYILIRHSTQWVISSPFQQEETTSWWEKDSE
ncbi:MAG: hypothetical protein ACW98Y_06860 [Candidatus Thorarchaeota archaeon]